MITVPKVDLGADRWVDMVRSLPIIGINLTGASFAMQVRPVADVGGTPVANLGTVTAASAEGVRLIYGGTDTVANHITAERLAGVPEGYTSTSSIVLSVIGIRIAAATMQAMPYPSERGNDAALAWDLHVTPSGGAKDKYAGGRFTVRAGVSQ